ncbi:MAG TPA: hypothetical protein VFT96_03440 [Gemmatimonadaceae bacterium]|nr:hypothetical protein [Gemmatimonadaceae bacterium]
MRPGLLLATAAAIVVAAAGEAGAQGASSADARLRQALDAPTYQAVSLVFDSARARGIPVRPLVNRALQATLHRTPGPRVHEAVVKLAGRLDVAKGALGPGSSEAELSAGANALAIGVPRATLVEIRALSPRQPVTVPLGVLTELVAREVTINRASQMVVALLRNGVTPAQLLSLSDDVSHDVNAGIEPGAAVDIRTRGALGTLQQGLGDNGLDTDARLKAPASAPGAGAATKVPRKP